MGLSDTRGGRYGWKKWIITIWAIMECFLFSGMVYGWGPISFVLKSEGIYADLCGNREVNSSYFINTNGMSSVSISSTMSSSISSRVPITNDDLLKSCNPQENRMALCFTIAASLFGVGGVVFGYVNYRFGTRVSYMFTSGGSIIVGLLNGAFDVSSVVMLLIKIAHEHGFIRQNMFILIAVLQSTTVISTFLFLPKWFIVKTDSDSNEVVKEKKADTDPDNKDVKPANTIKGLKTYLMNSKFLTLLIWFSVLHLRFQYFIGTLNQYLTRLLDTENEVSYFTNVCYFIMLGGLAGSFVSGAVYDWQSRKYKDSKSSLYRELMPSVLPLALTSMFAVLMSVLVLIPMTEVLYPIFIVMTIYRAFLYSSTAAYVSSMFPSQHFGIIRGVIEITGSVIATLQYAFFTWTEAYTEGPKHANVFLLCLASLSFTHPLYWGIKCWRDEKKVTSTFHKNATKM